VLLIGCRGELAPAVIAKEGLPLAFTEPRCNYLVLIPLILMLFREQAELRVTALNTEKSLSEISEHSKIVRKEGMPFISRNFFNLFLL
jgi:hypothetical protein